MRGIYCGIALLLAVNVMAFSKGGSGRASQNGQGQLPQLDSNRDGIPDNRQGSDRDVSRLAGILGGTLASSAAGLASSLGGLAASLGRSAGSPITGVSDRVTQGVGDGDGRGYVTMSFDLYVRIINYVRYLERLLGLSRSGLAPSFGPQSFGPLSGPSSPGSLSGLPSTMSQQSPIAASAFQPIGLSSGSIPLGSPITSSPLGSGVFSSQPGSNVQTGQGFVSFPSTMTGQSSPVAGQVLPGSRGPMSPSFFQPSGFLQASARVFPLSSSDQSGSFPFSGFQPRGQSPFSTVRQSGISGFQPTGPASFSAFQPFASRPQQPQPSGSSPFSTFQPFGSVPAQFQPSGSSPFSSFQPFAGMPTSFQPSGSSSFLPSQFTGVLPFSPFQTEGSQFPSTGSSRISSPILPLSGVGKMSQPNIDLSRMTGSSSFPLGTSGLNVDPESSMPGFQDSRFPTKNGFGGEWQPNQGSIGDMPSRPSSPGRRPNKNRGTY